VSRVSRFSWPSSWLYVLLLPALAGCSDLRATFEIRGPEHSLSLIRVTGMPWDKTAKYSIVASRMPDCMRRHAMPNASINARFEVYSPGNDAWIIKQNARMFVVETRTCEGFAKLDALPEGGLGQLAGTFEMSGEKLVFKSAPKSESSPDSSGASKLAPG
jgi:hypothetical protein